MPDAAPTADNEREAALRFVREAPFAYGVWHRFKALYKAAEASSASSASVDAELMGSLLARIDDSAISLGNTDPRLGFEGIRFVSGLVARGDYLFVFGRRDYSETRTLSVFARNPNDPMKPTRVEENDLGTASGAFGGATLCGSLLCFVLTGRNSGRALHIVDVSNPADIQPHSRFLLDGPVFLADGAQTYPYLYLTMATQGTAKFQGIRVLDLSNPDAPRLIGEVKTEGMAPERGCLAVQGGRIALATKPAGFNWRTLTKGGGLHLFEASRPGQPTHVGFLGLETPLCVGLHGGLAFVGIGSDVQGRSGGLQVVDVRDPRRPEKRGFLPLPYRVTQITVSPDGRYVYAQIQSWGTLLTVDVSDPAAPRHVGTTENLAGGESGLAFSGDSADSAYTFGWQGVALLQMTRPETPYRIGAPPTAETIGYMKRRGRRFLRGLAKADAGRYAEVATEMLLSITSTAGETATLDPARHWAAIDVLFGGGDRFRQTRHGRGRYVAGAAATGGTGRLGLRTREERAPHTWDARPDLLARLLQAPNLLLPVYAFAARALRANRHSLPPIPDAVLARWLASSEPLLVALGIRSAIARLLAGESLPPTLAADAFFSAGAKRRATLTRARGSAWASSRTWAEAFAVRLAARVAPASPTELRLSKRQLDGADLLVRYFSWALGVRTELQMPLVAPFLAANRADLREAVVGWAGTASNRLLVWLTQLGRVADPGLREPALNALAASVKDVALNLATLRQLAFHSDAFVREGGWRVIAGSAASGADLRAVWSDLLSSGQATPALTTAMASPDALGLLERAGIGSGELAGFIATRPFLAGMLSPSAFGAVARAASAAVVLSLVAASPEENWPELRPVWLRQLREGIGLTALWLGAETALANDASGRLEARLLGDREIAETLLGVDDDRVLAIRDPAFGPILGAWAARYADRFTRNSPLLFDAATHPLPEVRTPALARVAELGMDMPFALRLTESALPPSVAVGKTFFDAEPAGGPREVDYALALCDSPDADVRALGRAYVAARWATLPHERVLLALFENPAPEMQAFVAERLDAGDGAAAQAAPTFDAEVLRTTNRARAAKERIKVRQTSDATADSTLDLATLLTVARGRTPRDADWALGELARRAARGETIEGIVWEGVTGI